MPRNYVITARFNREEYEMVKEVSGALGVSMSEVIRRLLWTVRTIFSSYLPARQAIRDVAENEPTLAVALKPIPELMEAVLREMERRKIFLPSEH